MPIKEQPQQRRILMTRWTAYHIAFQPFPIYLGPCPKGWKRQHGGRHGDGVYPQKHHDWPGAHYRWMTALLIVECHHCDPLGWHHSSGGTSQIPGGRWFALDYFHNTEDNTLFSLKKLLALGFAFPSCTVSAKTPYWLSECLNYVLVFCVTLLLTRQLILQQVKCGIGLMFTESLVIFPITLKLLNW